MKESGQSPGLNAAAKAAPASAWQDVLEFAVPKAF